MRAALMIAVIALSCCGCTGPAPPLQGNDTLANTSANCDFTKGDFDRTWRQRLLVAFFKAVGCPANLFGPNPPSLWRR